MRLRDKGTRLRGIPVAGDYGNPDSIDWTEATLSKLDMACEFQPGGSSEQIAQQQQTVDQPQVWLAPDADIKATDRWRYRGEDFEVDGSPQVWTARGRDKHTYVKLQRVSGG